MPQINYQLSFENYQEMTANRQTMPSYTATLWVALAGLGLILGGYLYLRLPLPDRWSIVGGILLGSGLLLEFAATLLAFLIKPKRRNKVPTSILQREYRQHFADQRSIEYDQAGFRVKWYDGEDLRPWSTVRGLHDMKTVLVISTVTTHYWFPKAALEPDDHLAQLRTLASTALNSKQVLFRVPIKPTALGYVAASIFDYWCSSVRTKLLIYLAVTVALYWVLCADWGYERQPSPFYFILLPFVLPFCQVLYFLRKHFSVKWADSAREAEIIEDRVTYQTAQARIAYEYRLLHDWREIPGVFMLYVAPSQFHFIPKFGFTPSQIEQFRKLLEANFPSAQT